MGLVFEIILEILVIDFTIMFESHFYFYKEYF
jgi:hypothetical protein